MERHHGGQPKASDSSGHTQRQNQQTTRPTKQTKRNATPPQRDGHKYSGPTKSDGGQQKIRTTRGKDIQKSTDAMEETTINPAHRGGPVKEIPKPSDGNPKGCRKPIQRQRNRGHEAPSGQAR